MMTSFGGKVMIDFEGHAKEIEKSMKCLITSLYNIKYSDGYPSYPRRIALAVGYLQSTIDLLKGERECFQKYILSELMDDKWNLESPVEEIEE